jgi:hypothetical protein
MTAKMGDGKISSARRDPSRTRVNGSAISPISCHPDGPGSRGRADDGHRRRRRHGLAAKPAGRTSSLSGSEPWLTIASPQTATGRTVSNRAGADQLRPLLGPDTAAAGVDPRRPGEAAVATPADDGGVAVGRQRDREALCGGAHPAGADQLIAPVARTTPAPAAVKKTGRRKSGRMPRLFSPTEPARRRASQIPALTRRGLVHFSCNRWLA